MRNLNNYEVIAVSGAGTYEEDDDPFAGELGGTSTSSGFSNQYLASRSEGPGACTYGGLAAGAAGGGPIAAITVNALCSAAPGQPTGAGTYNSAAGPGTNGSSNNGAMIGDIDAP